MSKRKIYNAIFSFLGISEIAYDVKLNKESIKKLEDKLHEMNLNFSIKMASLETLLTNRLATQNSPTCLTEEGEQFLNSLNFDGFLEKNYEPICNLIEKENFQNKLEVKNFIEGIFFNKNSAYITDQEFKNTIADKAYDEGISEDQVLFLMSTKFERKYFAEKDLTLEKINSSRGVSSETPIHSYPSQ